MARALKVFRTAAGFYDAVVAAPSQKAALAAWGARENLFSSGAARIVDDPDLIARALASPGEIIRVPVASDAGLVAAAKPAEPTRASPSSARPAKAKPTPDRGPLTRAEAELARLTAEQARARAEVEAQTRALADRRRRLEAEWDDRLRRATAEVDAAQRAFQRASAE